jgi:hypothetical protein
MIVNVRFYICLLNMNVLVSKSLNLTHPLGPEPLQVEAVHQAPRYS